MHSWTEYNFRMYAYDYCHVLTTSVYGDLNPQNVNPTSARTHASRREFQLVTLADM